MFLIGTCVGGFSQINIVMSFNCDSINPHELVGCSDLVFSINYDKARHKTLFTEHAQDNRILC